MQRSLLSKADPNKSQSSTANPTCACQKCQTCRGSNLLPKNFEGEKDSERAAPVVQDVLRSPGQPLASETRNFMESRFGHDFGKVRIHADSKSAASALSVRADAYTVGQDVVFGDGKYSPHSTDGQRLLAHELTHVIQQQNVHGVTSQLTVSHPETAAEKEAEASSTAVMGLQPRSVSINQLTQPTLARQEAPLAEPPLVEPLPYEPYPEPLAPGAEPEPARVPTGPRAVPLPPELDTDPMRRAQQEWDDEQFKCEAERPTATLSRGGSPPDFITTEPEGTAMGEGGRITHFTPRAYHILDAIEYDVDQTKSEGELSRVERKYLPDTSAPPPSLKSLDFLPLTPTFFDPCESIKYPQNFDPNFAVRRATFEAAVSLKRKKRLGYDPRTEPVPPKLRDILLEQPVEEKQGPCITQKVPRAGGYVPHDDYATRVTGDPQDFKITTPEGMICQTDGIDAQGRTWEVKTGYRYLNDPGISYSLYSPRIQGIINGMEEQRARCVYVTSRCGYRYFFAFQRQEVVDFLNDHWGGMPLVIRRD